jgi:hypothetical protein
VVYELLVRDFDAGRNYQSIIDKSIILRTLRSMRLSVPVMEFEGNESWGIILLSYGFRQVL